MDKYFGKFGGQFVPEIVMNELDILEKNFEKYKEDEKFIEEFNDLIINYVGRETPLYYAKNLSRHYNYNIYLKREDLNHTGAHKINNAIGQALIAKKMGKTKIIAETGAGQHGVATATACALLGLECEVHMGKVDVEKQELNVFRMKLLGAKVVTVTSGLMTLKEATTSAFQTWIKNIDTTYYIIGSVVGPAPYPYIVSHFQSIIGQETKEQLNRRNIKADHIIACVGGGSNAIGIFNEFLSDESVKLYGIEASGKGIDTPYHAATLTKGSDGIIHGMKTKVLQNSHGDIQEVYSISSGLDYPGIGPMHANLFDTNRVKYDHINDNEAMDALVRLNKSEGILPAIESAHALAYLEKINVKSDENVIVNLSGRGDKDIYTIFQYLEGRDSHG